MPDDGLRIQPSPPSGGSRWWRRAATVAGLVALGLALAALLLPSGRPGRSGPVPPAHGQGMANTDTPAPPAAAVYYATPSWNSDSPELHDPRPAFDPDDLASYVRPGDPAPSAANVIRALNEAGIHEGLGAFNPPGTMPVIAGLAVPPDFALPPGYVRHHQFTDEGEPLEPILMFSPDVVPRGPDGQPLPVSADRVVPPEHAPPGLPIRWVGPPRP